MPLIEKNMGPRPAAAVAKKEGGKGGGAPKKRGRGGDAPPKGPLAQPEGDDKENVLATADATPVPRTHKKSRVAEYHHVPTAEPEHRANNTEAPKKPDPYKRVSGSRPGGAS